MKEKEQKHIYGKTIKVWLIIGLVMVLVQVILGSITRLTGSGLSITKWDIVTGTLPPLNAEAWLDAFEMYKNTPQFEKINVGMDLAAFKFIFFWEYFHRLWARMMGFVFAIPFFIFLAKGMLQKHLVRRLGGVVLLAALAASFGWIMVASGLVNRPWVNAYKLSLHLSIAFMLFAYLLWTVFEVLQPNIKVIHNKVLKKRTIGLLLVLSLQIMLGGIMSGMKAGMYYPTWPDMNGFFIPTVLMTPSEWNVDNLVNYDTSPFMPAIIQFLHRAVAYLLIIIGLRYFLKLKKLNLSGLMNNTNYLLISMLIIQILLGIFTVINCLGYVPLLLGVLHQIGALLLLSITLFLLYIQQKENT